jgi:hypothetical protein
VCSSDLSCKVLQTRRPATCYFCLANPQACLVPACRGWEPAPPSAAADSLAPRPQGINMCTPYTQLAQVRDEALARAEAAERACAELRAVAAQAEAEKSAAKRALGASQDRLRETEARLHEMEQRATRLQSQARTGGTIEQGR